MNGIDCSGLVMELLMAAGVFPHKTDLSAQGIFDALESKSGSGWGAGCLAFYGESIIKIKHVGFCVDAYMMLEAGGGDSTTVTLAEAIAKNAFVRLRPIKYRKDFLCVIRPSYATIGIA